MKYFKQEDFDKCMEFLVGKPKTVETQQELHNYMVYEHMYPDMINITVKDMGIYARIYATIFRPGTANWCSTLSDGSQVVWNRKYREFFLLEEIGMDRCDYLNYKDMFPEMRSIDEWMLECWCGCVYAFRDIQKQLVDIWNGKYSQHFINRMR